MLRITDKLRRREQVTIVAFGDSITEPTWHTAGRLNWVGLLHEALVETYGRRCVMMINAGCCGDTAVSAIERLDRDVLRFHPDLAIVSFGMNDALADQKAANVAIFEAAIRQIIETIRPNPSASTEILLRTPNPVIMPALPDDNGNKPGLEWARLSHAKYSGVLRELAAQLGCSVVDHYALWVEQPRRPLTEDPNHLWMRMSDPIHPGPLGHLCFFREMAPLFGLPDRFPWEL